MVAPRTQVEAPRHRRKRPRLRLGIPVRVETLHGNFDGRLLDLSETGAKVAMDSPSGRGEALLEWLSHEAFGEIVWRRGDAIGIRFDQPLSPEQLMRTRQLAPSILRDHDPTIEAARMWAQGY